MKATKFIAAAAVLIAAGSAFAADAPAANAAVTAAATSVAGPGIAATSLNVPAVTITASGTRSRAEVRAEAIQFVKNYKTPLALQLEQYKN